jgi:cephalosporin-C deacetylase
MPLVDMPMEKLLSYEGRNPKPTDHEAYWKRALKELAGTDPQVELVKADYQLPFAECFHLYFTGVKGSRVHAKYLRPKNSLGKHPAVVQFHGYSGSSGDWHDKVPYAALGFSVFSLDCRGQGGRSQDLGGTSGNTLRGHIIRGLDGGPDDLLFRQIFLDTAQIAGIAMNMPEVDAKRVGCFGGSQGGALTIACAALEPRIKRAAPVFPFLSDYKRVWEMDQAKAAYEELQTYFRHFDPLHEREEEVFTKLGYIDIQFLAPRIKAEVLMGVGLMDPICPPSTQYAAYNKMKCKKSTVIYPDFGHEGLPGFNDKTLQFLAGL